MQKKVLDNMDILCYNVTGLLQLYFNSMFKCKKLFGVLKMVLRKTSASEENCICSMRSIDKIKQESDKLRNGTTAKINELERDIALIIAEYDDEIAQSAHIDKSKFVSADQSSNSNLSDSVRMIKIRKN